MLPRERPKQKPPVRLIDRFELLGFRGRYIEGVWVGGLDKQSPGWRAIEQALGLIKQHDPVRFNRLKRDLARVWVRILAGNEGEYNASLDACTLDDRFLLAQAPHPERIAAAIVHEATHARLWNSGIGYEEPIRIRVEAVCFKRERAFAARLPDGEEIRARAEAKLAYYTFETWTNAALSARHEAGAAQALRDLGQPEWLIRSTFAFNARWRRFVGLFRAGKS